MTHRIFIAFNISEKLKQKIDLWKKEFKIVSAATFNHIRWVPKENLHITLIPPFKSSQENIKRIGVILKEVSLNQTPIDVIFNEIDFGPNLFNPRLIWITGENSQQILKLKKQLLTKLSMLDIELDLNLKRDYFLHLTIARFNQLDYKYFNIKKIKQKFEFKETLNEIILYESFLRKEGAQYQLLQSVNLNSSPIQQT